MKSTIIKAKIYNHNYSIRFIDGKLMPKNVIGFTHCNNEAIDINRELQGVAIYNTLVHEIVHAILDCQGRQFQKEFGLEEMCEFIARNLNEINCIVKDIMSKLPKESEN